MDGSRKLSRINKSLENRRVLNIRDEEFGKFSNGLQQATEPQGVAPRRLTFEEDSEADTKKSKPTRLFQTLGSSHIDAVARELCSTPNFPQTYKDILNDLEAKNPKDDDSFLMSYSSKNTKEDEYSSFLMSSPVSSLSARRDTPNLNPFSLEAQKMSNSGQLGESFVLSSKSFQEASSPRFNTEFKHLGVIGTGQFGCVIKCKNKLDGCEYAIKKSLKPLVGTSVEQSAITEMYALAALGQHPNIVRYFSAWTEEEYMLIQSEYCSGGSLLNQFKYSLDESELRVLLKHISFGLKYIHSNNLSHMDLKPANILIAYVQHNQICFDIGDDSEDEAEVGGPGLPRFERIYKIGDFGHATLMKSRKVEEGDCRYLPKEILQETYSDLSKGDIFAFGLTLFQAGGGGDLPQNGPLWHQYRDGMLPQLENLSGPFNNMIQLMVDPNPNRRPSARQILKSPLICPLEKRTKHQLTRALAAAQKRNKLLEQQLMEVKKWNQSLLLTSESECPNASDKNDQFPITIT